jgi:hypothetical protein
VLSLAFAQPPIRPRREITLIAQTVPLSVRDPSLDRVGSLKFLSGLALRSEDPGFGGLSGLTVEEKAGELTVIAITDEGEKLAGRLVTKEGRLTGLDHVTLEPLVNPEGAPVAGKVSGDAESISRLPDGRVLVGFERRHRIWAYGPGLSGRATVFETPAELERAPSNGGVESIANWPDGRILAITEQLQTAASNLAAFLFKGKTWTALEWKPSDRGFEPSDATVLPDGDLLVLERLWSPFAPTTLRSRLLRVKGEAVKGGAVLQGTLLAELAAPLIAENFEGVSTFRNRRGATQLLLVSDDNFNGAQRTLLLWFEIEEPSISESP